jgi:hypothetical protein
MNDQTAQNHRRRWVRCLQCLGIALSAAFVVAFFFCPAFPRWKGVVLVHGPLATDYGRAVAAYHQIENPWEPVAIPLHKVIAWRLLFPVLWHYLKLPYLFYLVMPHLGCLIVLSLTASVSEKRLSNWLYTWMAVALVAALPWFFVSTGWLGYFDSWLVLGMFIVSFLPPSWTLISACLLVPWIDERFLFALPLCMIVRFIVLQNPRQVGSRKVVVDAMTVVFASLVYPAIRFTAWLNGDVLATNYLSAHWEELQSVPWQQFVDGLWSAYRAAWIMILAGVYFSWRRAHWIWAAAFSIVVAISAVGSLFIAADMSRSTMIVLPAMLLGIWLWNDFQPRIFKWALPTVLVANLLLPAAHVMWSAEGRGRIPIHNFFVARAEPLPPYLVPQVYIQQAQEYLEIGQTANAELAFDAALRLDERFVPAYVLRAVYRSQKGDLVGAKSDIQTALQILPESPEARFVSAQIAALLGDMESAKSEAEKALQLSPPNWPQRNEAQKFLNQLDKPR